VRVPDPRLEGPTRLPPNLRQLGHRAPLWAADPELCARAFRRVCRHRTLYAEPVTLRRRPTIRIQSVGCVTFGPTNLRFREPRHDFFCRNCDMSASDDRFIVKPPSGLATHSRCGRDANPTTNCVRQRSGTIAMRPAAMVRGLRESAIRARHDSGRPQHPPRLSVGDGAHSAEAACETTCKRPPGAHFRRAPRLRSTCSPCWSS
jgi:hypothetical protein